MCIEEVMIPGKGMGIEIHKWGKQGIGQRGVKTIHIVGGMG
jgi:hypothetical protein